MLKPAVITTRVDWCWLASRRQKFREFNRFCAQAHARDPCAKTEYAGQVFIGIAIDLGLRDLLEMEDGGIEFDGPIQIRYRQADSIHTVYQRVRSGGEESAGQEQRTE